MKGKQQGFDDIIKKFNLTAIGLHTNVTNLKTETLKHGQKRKETKYTLRKSFQWVFCYVERPAMAIKWPYMGILLLNLS